MRFYRPTAHPRVGEALCASAFDMGVIMGCPKRVAMIDMGQKSLPNSHFLPRSTRNLDLDTSPPILIILTIFCSLKSAHFTPVIYLDHSAAGLVMLTAIESQMAINLNPSTIYIFGI